VEGSEFDEVAFFRSLRASGVRALLIGRRALVVLGLPVLTADYDLWIHVDDAALLNEVAAPFGLLPTRSPEEARTRGRYSLENDELVDVLLARSVPTIDGSAVAFDEIWPRRQEVVLAPGVSVSVPALDDLIATKRFAARPKDAEDIRMLEALRSRKGL
jgi:hypothetical protein